MTPDERNLLQRFLGDLQSSRGAQKDPEADGMIADALRANPDAGYLLVQHAMLADQALQAAQGRIEQLENGGGQAPAPTSFLGGGGQGSGGQGGGGYGQDRWEERDEPQQAQQAAPQQPQPTSPLSQNSGLGGFMRTAGTMAAGVAGGEFLAQGLSNLFSPRDW